MTGEEEAITSMSHLLVRFLCHQTSHQTLDVLLGSTIHCCRIQGLQGEGNQAIGKLLQKRSFQHVDPLPYGWKLKKEKK